MQVAIREDDEAAILRFGVLARLLLADQGIFVFRLGFEYNQGKAGIIEQKEVDETVAGLFEVFSECVDRCLGQLDLGFENDVGLARSLVEEAPAGLFEQLIDLDASFGFFGSYLGSPSVFAETFFLLSCKSP